MKRDENNMIAPIAQTAAPASAVPSAYPKRAAQSQRQEENGAEGATGKPVGREEIAKAKETLRRYMSSKRFYDQRVRENYDIYNLLYTESTAKETYKDEDGNLRERLVSKKIGAQSLNVIMNKHADASDNYPEVICLPRSRDDERTAHILNSVIPCVLERNGFRRVYSRAWTDKLVGGAGLYVVKWDSGKERGMGDIDVSNGDILRLFWEPHIENIQDSRNVFYVTYMEPDDAKELYPQLKEASTEDMGLEEYRTYDNESKSRGKAAVVGWYYKRDGAVHFAQFCGETLLFSSENEEKDYPNGFYEHGRYPFVLDPLFYLKDTPVSFSFIDICRHPQESMDDLKRDILTNVKVNSQPRDYVNSAAGVNMADLNDLNKVHIEVDGNPSDVSKPIEAKDIAAGGMGMYDRLCEEMKETTGTNDPSNGAGTAGVTSGTAIAALQEAGGKISRDINQQGFFAFTEICEIIIELMRQFYTTARYMRITGDDHETDYEQVDNSGLQPQPYTVEGSEEVFARVPVFDIEVKAQRSSPFTTAANNQMMIDMFNMGMFAPENADAAIIALEGMSFEGKDRILEMVKRNQTLQQALTEMQNKMQMQSAMLAQQQAQEVAAESVPLPTPQPEGAKI